MNDPDIERQAKAWAKDKKNINAVYKSLIGNRDFSDLELPAAIFMAGSPGAGKTEISKALASNFKTEPVRIDADDFRSIFPGYNGTNSNLFQVAATTMVQKVLDRILDSGRHGSAIPFILDGTFSYARTKDNLQRTLRHGYAVEIYYVYQKPELAWQFTKARELEEGRVVPLDVFAHSFVRAYENVLEAKRMFGDQVNLSLIIKDNDAHDSQVHTYISAEDLEKTLLFPYNEDNIKEIIASL